MIVVILAGGEGRRIGGGKPVRLLGGETLIDRAVRIALSWSGDVHIGGESAMGLPVIRDDPAIEGPLGGVAAALRLGGDVLTIPCDMPFLPDDLAQRLGDGAQAATIAESGGRLHPVCALWRARAALGLADYVASGGRSLRGFADAVGYEAVAWGSAPIDPFFNINDEEDLARAEALLRNR